MVQFKRGYLTLVTGGREDAKVIFGEQCNNRSSVLRKKGKKTYEQRKSNYETYEGEGLCENGSAEKRRAAQKLFSGKALISRKKRFRSTALDSSNNNFFIGPAVR